MVCNVFETLKARKGDTIGEGLIRVVNAALMGSTIGLDVTNDVSHLSMENTHDAPPGVPTLWIGNQP
jgi:hypothetical protein